MRKEEMVGKEEMARKEEMVRREEMVGKEVVRKLSPEHSRPINNGGVAYKLKSQVRKFLSSQKER